MKQTNLPDLPINTVLDELKEQLRASISAVLVAPPGAGKTTRVPLALLNEAWLDDKHIIVLEPRRIAARSAANFMAKLLGEKIGQTVGYRVRMESKVSAASKVIVVTEGVFTRMVLDDPELSKVGAVLFDEYHERSLDADLGLALALDIQSSLRPDLRIMPMSATLDGARVSQLFDDVQVVESEGRAFSIEIKHIVPRANERVVETMASAIINLSKNEAGSFLCFLPGQGEIIRCAKMLEGKLAADIDVTPLYGSLPPKEQDRAIQTPDDGRRKIVLATSIAETSITIDGVRVVIDSGLARVPKYEAEIGLTRLETIKASKASITQRAGRAGRTQAGTVYRLWHEGQTNALPDFERPEILESDLSSLVLDLALWGVGDPTQLKWIDPPPAIGWKQAKEMLTQLGALDANGLITAHGKQLQKMPLPPRLATMVIKAAMHGKAKQAAQLALLISERGVGGNSPDLAERLKNLQSDRSSRGDKIKKLASSIASKLDDVPASEELSIGALLSFAYSDRIAKKIGNNDRGEALYQLANGRRAAIDGLSPLAANEHLVVGEMQGTASASRLLSGAAILKDEILVLHEVARERSVEFDLSSKQFKANEVVKLRRLTLTSQPVKLSADDNVAQGLISAIAKHGLRLIDLRKDDKNAAARLRTRLNFLHQQLPEHYPDVGDEVLIDGLESWLLPVIENCRSLEQISPQTLCDGLNNLVGYEKGADIDRLAPANFKAPSGSNMTLRYEDEKVVLPIRVQELYGLSKHPLILDGTYPLTIELLSPAQRPIQMTKDIVGFWQGSWQDVKKEMKGRYPRHLWPDDPASATPTTRTKKKS